MVIWIDAQLPPQLARWLEQRFDLSAHAVRELGLRDSTDEEIFASARQADAVVITKDADFPEMLERMGPPPRIIWLTCGNTSNAALQALLERYLASAMTLLEHGEPLVEISGPPG